MVRSSSTWAMWALWALWTTVATAQQTLFVSHYNGNLYTLTLTGSGTSSKLAITGTTKAGGQMPAWLELDSESKALYVVDESGANKGSQLMSLSVAANGQTRVTATANSPGGDVHGGFYGGPNGKGFLALAQYDSSSVATFKLPLTAGAQRLQQLKWSGPLGPRTDRQNAPHPHGVFNDPTNRFLIAPDLGSDLIRIFSVNPQSGALTECTHAKTNPGDGPRHAAFWKSASGSYVLYVINELGNSITAYSVAHPSGGGCMTLTRMQSLSTYAAGKTPPSGSKAAEVHVYGNFVYAVNRADRTFGAQQDSFASYTLDPSTGSMTLLEIGNTYTYFPRTFAINKAGDMVAFGGQTSANVAIVARDKATGKLGPLLTQLQVGSPGQAQQENGMSAVIWNE